MDIKDIFKEATFVETPSGCRVVLQSEVSRNDYLNFKKMVEMAGGVYLNRAKGHSFQTPVDATRKQLENYMERMSNNIHINKEEFFPTPEHVADTLISDMALYDQFSEYLLSGASERNVRVLEPSAGDGALIDAMLRANPGFNGEIMAIEIDPLRAQLLREKYADKEFTVHVLEDDFMSLDKETIGEFDIALINPPFQLWDTHLKHAKSLLAEKNSFIAAILPNLENEMSKSRQSPKTDMATEILAYCNTQAAIHRDVTSGEFNKHAKKRGSAQKTTVPTSTYITSPENERIISKKIEEMANLCLENYSGFYKQHHDAIILKTGDDILTPDAAIDLINEFAETIKKEQVKLIKAGAPVTGSLQSIAGRYIMGCLDGDEDAKSAIRVAMCNHNILPYYDVTLTKQLPGIPVPWAMTNKELGEIVRDSMSELQGSNWRQVFHASVDEEPRLFDNSPHFMVSARVQALDEDDAIQNTRRLTCIDDATARYHMVTNGVKQKMAVWNNEMVAIEPAAKKQEGTLELD